MRALARLHVAVLARSVYPLHRYGGLERHVYDLVRCLLDRDLRVTLISPPASRRTLADPVAEEMFRRQNFTHAAVPYRTFPFANRRGTTIIDRSTAYPVFGIRAGRLAARLAAAGSVDIVHGLGASALGYATAPRQVTGAPLVFNPQGLEEFGATNPQGARLKRLAYWPLRVAVRRCAREADRVIATDRSLVAPVMEHLGVDQRQVRVIPNAIELSECDRPESAARAIALRDRIGLTADDTLLLSVGRLEANKGFGVLIRALADLSSGGRLSGSWRWVLAGDGPARAELEHATASAGLGRHVVFCGRVSSDDLHGWYEAATLFVHPTLYEGSSLVTLEAMAHRRAVIASRAGGLPDKVFPALNGWLIDPGDSSALARAIAEALSNRMRLKQMGQEGRAIVERDFSWRAAMDRLLDVYGELVDRRGHN